MARDLTADLAAEIAADHAAYTFLLEFQFSGGTLHYTTAPFDIRTAGFTDPPGPPDATFVGVGGVFQIEDIQETEDMKAQGAPIRLSGVDTEIIASILTNRFRGRKARFWLAHFDLPTGDIVSDPYLLLDGKMNSEFRVTQQTTRGSGRVDVETRIVSRLAELQQKRGILMNVESHHSAIPEAATNGDLFFQHVAEITGRQIYWGQPEPEEPSKGGGSGGGGGGGGGGGERGPSPGDPFRPTF